MRLNKPMDKRRNLATGLPCNKVKIIIKIPNNILLHASAFIGFHSISKTRLFQFGSFYVIITRGSDENVEGRTDKNIGRKTSRGTRIYTSLFST
jgi:hypothetical protein